MARPLRRAERIGRAIDETWSQARLVLRATHRMRAKLGAIIGQLDAGSSNPIEVALLGELKAVEEKLVLVARTAASTGKHFISVTEWLPRKEDRRG